MKTLLFLFTALTLCSAPCSAQFGTLSKILKGAKTAKEEKKAHDNWGNQKVKDIYKDVSVDTTSAEYKKAVAEAQQKMYESSPQLKKMMELKGDTAAMRKYMEELYGGMSQEEMTRKMMKDAGVDYDSKVSQDAHAKVQKMSGVSDDPVFKKIMAEQRQPTMEEATYLNEKYGTTFEYKGMEAFNDSVGVFAHLDGRLKPMAITKCEKISDERPVIDFGQDAIKQYVQDHITLLKKPLADREIVDSVQNYMIYNNRNSDVQFKGIAKFTLYSNLETNINELKVNDLLLRKISDFTEPIDPKNIFVFKVHKGIGCRYMEYKYTKISYKQSELMDYISKRLVNEGYIDANINQKMSDEQMFKAMDLMEFEFKVEKLLKIRQNNEKFMYTNTIPTAKNVKLTYNSRKIGHVTALDVYIEAEPGEYAFIIRDPEVEKYVKELDASQDKGFYDFDISVLTEGAFFFTIK